MESVNACWTSFSLSSRVMDGILAILCGVGIFLLLLPFLPSEPAIPQCRKHRHISKHQKEPTERTKKAKKPEALNDDLKQLKRTQNLIACPQSMEWTCQDKGSLCPLPVENGQCKAVSAGTQSPLGQRAPARSPATPTAPLTEDTLCPQLSAFGSGPQRDAVSRTSDPSQRDSQPPPTLALGCPSHQLTFSPPPLHLPHSETSPPTLQPNPASQWERPTQSPAQCHSLALPLATVPQSSSLYPPWPASRARIISGIGHSTCTVSTFSSCNETAQTLSLCLPPPSSQESQHEDISCPTPRGLVCGGPTNRQKDCKSLSLIKSGNVASRSEQEIKTIKESGTNLEQTIPDNHMGTKMTSLSAETKTRAASPSWSTTGQSEQLPSSQQLSEPKDSGDNVHQEYKQLFWGLPSLHSESLVGTAWLSKNSSYLLFNGMVGTSTGKMHPNISLLFSQAKPRCPLLSQSQHLSGNLSLCQPPPIAQIKAKLSVQNIPPSSPLQKADCEDTASSAEHKVRFLTQFGSPHSEWPLLRELESGWSLPPAAERSQQIFSVCSSSSPKDNLVASILPEYFPVSSELRDQLENHLQKWLIQHQWELSHRIQESLELKRQQGTRAQTGQVENKAGNLKASALTGESSNNTQHSKYLAQGPGSKEDSGSSREILVAKREESDSDSGLSSSESESDILRTLTPKVERTLRNHFVRKYGKTYEGLIPVRVARSWLEVSDAGWIPGGHVKKNRQILKQCENCRNTSERAEFLDSLTRSLLEAHIVKLLVKHRWGLPHKLIKAINLFGLKGQPSSNPKLASPHSATCASGMHSRVKCVNFEGEFPQYHVGEELKHKEVSIPERPAQAPSPVSEKIQKVCGEISFAGNHDSTGISLSRPTKDSQPTESFTSSLKARHWQSGSVDSAQKESSELNPSSRNGSRTESINWVSQGPCHREQTVAMKLGTLRAKETTGRVEAKESTASQSQSKATLELCLQKTTNITNMPKRANEYPQTSPDPLFPKLPVFQHPEGPCLNTGATSVFNSMSEYHPGEYPKRVLQRAQDLPSCVPQYHIPRNPTGDQLARPLQGVLKRDQRNTRETNAKKQALGPQQEEGVQNQAIAGKVQKRFSCSITLREWLSTQTRSEGAAHKMAPLFLKDYDPRGLLTTFGTQRLLTEMHLDCDLSFDPMPPWKGKGFSLSAFSFHGVSGCMETEIL
ncbi:spermatogenesis-associated protein 31A6-like [Sorex araneus]|uniref:spermatogenesis-associated protein 31A6-like n=1 Tax=Sorex araneus TaxID=42254 RepID=UPI0024334A3F|nr:spermatogenesis-associated protein 31A6-like [Sorex araneus]